MRVKILGSVIGTAAILLVSGSASAGLVPALETDITVNDGIANSSHWTSDDDRTYTVLGVGEKDVLEDNETEFNAAPGQQWDLEMFNLSGQKLTAFGGFDGFATDAGYHSGSTDYGAGDIFIATPGTPSAPQAYNYVFDMHYGTGGYDIYDISDMALTNSAYFEMTTYVGESNPYRLLDLDTAILKGSGSYEYYSGLTDAQAGEMTGETGNDHYAVTIDLMDLFAALDSVSAADPSYQTSFIAHLTMSCGNDTLMGAGDFHGGDHPVPEPATMLLFGTGLVGLAAIGRKKNAFRKKA